MATLNYAFKELSCKIVYYGCGLCGKTTNLIHIHKTVPQKFRGELVSLATEQDRTLFFDFLPLDLGEVKGFKTKFQLYTVPGQVYYNATRKLVLRGVDGLVFVVDSQKDRLQENIDSLENLKQNLAEYGYHLQAGADDTEGIPWVIQFNKRDMPQVSTAEELNAAINPHGVPTLDSVAVTGVGVKDTLKAISSLVIKKLNAETASPAGATAPSPAAATSAAKQTPATAPAPPSPAAAKTPSPPRPPVAPATPPQQPAKPKAAPAPPPPPAKPAAAAPRRLQITQHGKASLRGMGLGRANITLSGEDGAASVFKLTGRVSFLGLFGSSFERALEKVGPEERAEGTFTRFNSSDGARPELELFLKDGEPKELYLNYIGRLGHVQVSPLRKPPLA